MSPRLWVLSPVYLDVPSYRILRERLREVLAEPSRDRFEVRFAVVDDSGGVDREVRALAGESIEVLTPPFNLGHQRALVFGLRSLKDAIADDDLVVTLDADGEDRPDDVPRLLAPLLATPGELHLVVLALRTRRRESPSFKVLYALFKALFLVLTGTVVRTGNFAAYRGWIARRLLFHPHFDLCYSSSFLGLGRGLLFVPCERGVRYAGESRMSSVKLMMHGMRMLMPFLDRIAMRALIVFTVTLCFGGCFAIWVVGVKLFTNLAIPGWATYTLLLVLILCFVAIGSFVILFVLFSQSQGVSLSSLDRDGHGT